MYGVVKLAYLRQANAHDGDRVLRTLASRRDLTAWVCYNDEIALPALSWVRERNIAVPGTLTVTGFDDIPQASLASLTTYSFGLRRVARGLVRGILDGRSMSRSADLTSIGHVVERSTSGNLSR
jgi:DNA-binding LacI/PurR family transcriptional regulator